MKLLYGFLALIGLVLPFTQLITWIIDNGLDVNLFIQQAMENKISIFAWLDVIITVVVIIIMVINDGRKYKISFLWIPIVGSLTVGASLGLPLFLLMRELRMDKIKREN